MTAEQLLEEAQTFLDECTEAADNDQDIVIQGRTVSAYEAQPVVEFMTEMIREFVVSQSKPGKKRS